MYRSWWAIAEIALYRVGCNDKSLAGFAADCVVHPLPDDGERRHGFAITPDFAMTLTIVSFAEMASEIADEIRSMVSSTTRRLPNSTVQRASGAAGPTPIRR